MATKKKRIINDSSLIDSSFLQPIFGGDTTAPANDPNNIGHLHDGGNTWGHVAPIDLSAHTTGRLTLQDTFAVARSVSSYPSIVATANTIISGTLLNIPNSSLLTSKAAITVPNTAPLDTLTINSSSSTVSGTFGTSSGNTPTSSNITGIINGVINLAANSVFTVVGASTPDYPFTIPGIITSAIWYFSIPFDMDVTKPAYFSFEWMGDILTIDAYGNTILDPTKITNSIPQAQTTTFRVTWQWYSAGYSILPPAVIYDGYTPANLPGTNINTNSLTRGRIPNLTINALPFQLTINDSVTNTPNYVGLAGLQQTTGAIMVGIQIDVLSSGFVNNQVGSQSGHIKFYQGNLIYLSKTLGSPITAFKTF
jgi:hypothetical protein